MFSTLQSVRDVVAACFARRRRDALQDGRGNRACAIPRQPNAIASGSIRHRAREHDDEAERDMRFINLSCDDDARCVRRAFTKSGRRSGGQIGFDGLVAICVSFALGRSV
jgi:hypothetical protein